MTTIYTFFLLAFSFFLLGGGSALADNHFSGEDASSIVQATRESGEEQIREMPSDGMGKEKDKALKNDAPKKSYHKYYKRPKGTRYPRCSECD
jgi:hypothetical protein